MSLGGGGITLGGGAGGGGATIPALAALEDLMRPTGVLVENFSRYGSMANVNALTSGTLKLTGPVLLKAGVAYSSMAVDSATTAAVTPTNQWACLVRVSDRAVLTKSADDTTAAWGSNTAKTFNFATGSGAYTPSVDELAYPGLLVAAATTPTLNGWTLTIAPTTIRAPQIGGNSTTGLTNPASLGATAAALSATNPHLQFRAEIG